MQAVIASATTSRWQPTRAEAPRVETLRPGESVIINLRGRSLDRLNAWVGVVLAVDAVAIRLDAKASRFTLSWNLADGERVIPWSQVESVEVVAPGKEDPDA